MFGLNRRGDMFIQSLTLTLVSVFAILFVLIYFKGKNSSYGGQSGIQGVDYGMYPDEYDNVRDLDRMVRTWKDEADLVLVGHLMKPQEGAAETIMSGYGFFDLAVDTVERGRYPYDLITVYVGWFPAFPPPEQYPLYVRQRYYPGQRMRIYLNIDESGGYGYYTPGAYFTIEPTI
ncbi:MAG: hypothetical protein ABIC68_05615 [Candidatus Omnitrophota bacterium]